LLLLAGTGWSARASDAARPVKAVTLRECIERALQNNLSIQLERLSPQIGQWGVVAQQGVYDPVLSGGLSYREATQLLDPQNAASLGVNSLESEVLQADIQLGGKLPSGATYGIGATESRSAGTLNSDFVYTGGWLLSGTQPLLKNGWGTVNSAAIRIARKNHQISQEQFTRQVMDVVFAVQVAYADLIFARENYKAKVEDLTRAKTLLAENRKRVEVGVLSPLDVTQAEAGAAEREEAVVVAERAIRDAENALNRLISADYRDLARWELTPAETPAFEMVDLDVTRSTRLALAQRPEYAIAKANCEKQDITVQYQRNQLWPQVDLVGTYGYNARSPLTTNRASSFHNYLGNLVDSDAPVWSVGVVVSYPLGNRRDRSNYRIARLQATQAVLDLKRLEQDILIEVDNAVGKVATNLKRIDATRAAARLAEESLQAEQQKLRAGTSTSFLVLQAQAQLAAARSAEIQARADYDKSLAALARAEGTTLQKNQVVVDDPSAPRR
jgi:outer membrane protein TolC